MSNLEMLEKITQGTDAVETVTIKIDDEDVEFLLRPLTSGELTRLQTLEKKGFVMKVGVNGAGKRQSVTSNTDVDVNAGEFNRYQSEAMFKAIAWSLSTGGENVTEDMIQNLPPSVPEQLFNEVIRISKLSDNDLTVIKTFRKN